MTSLQYPFTAYMRPNFSEELYVKILYTARDQIHGPQIFKQTTSLFLHIHKENDEANVHICIKQMCTFA